jgi:hypothetical protein
MDGPISINSLSKNAAVIFGPRLLDVRRKPSLQTRGVPNPGGAAATFPVP